MAEVDERKKPGVRFIPDGRGGFNRLLDGDTEVDASGQRFRRQGSNTRELAGVKDDKYGDPKLTMPERGAAYQTEIIQKVIEDGKFFNIEDTGKVDDYGRKIIRRFNDDGEDLDETLIASGITEPTLYTDASVLKALEAKKARRQLYGDQVATDFELLGDSVQNKFDEQGIRFKTTALNEANYSPNYHSGVAFRDYDRNLDNEQRGFWGQAGTSFVQSWQGIKEGAYGYLDAVGQMTDAEMFENLGEQGVARARANIREMPSIILDYREVDDVFSGFQYVMNNTAMAAPYLGVSIGAMALAVPVGLATAPIVGPGAAGMIALGSTAVPNSVIFAGQIWNEMEGDKGAAQFVTATLGGVSMSVIERFGLSKLLPKSTLLNSTGIKKGAEALVKQRQEAIDAGRGFKMIRGEPVPLTPLTLEEAERVLKQAVRSEQKRMLQGLVDIDPEMMSGFALSQVGKNVARGAAVESATEVIQESIQMATAAGFSDKQYSPEAIKNRLINAAIAGGTVGGTISGIGGGRNQLKNYLERRDKLNKGDPNKLDIVAKKKVSDVAAGVTIPSIDQDIRATDQQTRMKDAARVADVDLQVEREPLVSEEDRDQIYAKDKVETSSLPKAEATQVISEAINDVSNNKDFDIETKANEIANTKGEEQAKLYLEAAQAKLQRIADATARPKSTTAKPRTTAQSLHDRYKAAKVGIRNYFTSNTELGEYIGTAAKGTLNLLRGAEKAAISAIDLVKSNVALRIMARVGMTTFGKYFDGDNHRAYKDKVEGELRRLVDPLELIRQVLFDVKARLNKKNIQKVSRILKEFGRNGGMERVEAFLKAKAEQDVEPSWNDYKGDLEYTKEQALAYHYAGKQLDYAYRAVFDTINTEYFNETGETLNYVEGYWWKFEGFDWRKVKDDKEGFIAWAKSAGLGNNDVVLTQLFESIAHRGEAFFGEEYSLVSGTQPWVPWTFNPLTEQASIKDPKGFSRWASDNLFEQLHRSQREAAKYASSTKYFGHNGRKLDALFEELEDEGILSQDQIDKLAYYVISMINSEHGNFNRVQNESFAKLNSILTNWSIFAGLTLSAAASFPETAMIYFKVNDDALFKRATKTIFEQLGGAYADYLAAEVKRSKAYLERTGLTAQQSSAVDRLASGEKDIAFLRAHEAFFSAIGLTTFTQFQRRINASFAIDFVRTNMQTLLWAPRKDYRVKKLEQESFSGAIPGDIEGTKQLAEQGGVEEGFDFDKFNAEQLRAYNVLSDVGLDVEGMYEAYVLSDEVFRDSIFNIEGEDSDSFYIKTGQIPLREAALKSAAKQVGHASESKKDLFRTAEALDAFIIDQMETAIYVFVNERIQNPQSSNRPLFFQDPHYQLLTQFNGFISTFTSVVIPQLYRNQLAKGTMQVKYDTFMLLVMLMVLGGASQYIKDMIKFGKPSPYLDTSGYIQRALYSSGVLGQYERAVEVIAPLYPDRRNWLLSTLGGETGPSSRNIQKVLEGGADLLQGDTEGAAKAILSTAPVTGSINRLRDATTDVLHFRNPADSLGYQDSYLKSLVDQLS